MHVRMLDLDNRLQQEAIGMLGVNLHTGLFISTILRTPSFQA